MTMTRTWRLMKHVSYMSGSGSISVKTTQGTAKALSDEFRERGSGRKSDRKAGSSLVLPKGRGRDNAARVIFRNWMIRLGGKSPLPNDSLLQRDEVDELYFFSRSSAV
jgi:hypothetical protein